MQDDHPWIQRLSSFHSKEIDLSLARVRKVGDRAGLFSLKSEVVLVAGTNGKGSTIDALGRLCRASGLSVGTYTSPHLIVINERIQFNGQPIGDACLIEALEVVEALREDTPLTFFEFLTLAALYFFKKNQPDILLAEIGMGGRLDAVNCLTPTLSIVTSIGLDHQAWLGSTVEEIAFEKAGIFREGKPCIVGQDALVSTLLKHAEALACKMLCAGESFDWLAGKREWHYQDNSPLSIPNHNLPENSVSLALAAYQQLTKTLALVPLPYVVGHLENATLPGRFQKLSFRPEIIVDVAHNIDSCQLLKHRLINHPVDGRRFAIWAMLDDKDSDAVANLFKNTFEAWYIPSINSPRMQNQQKLVESLIANGVKKIYCRDSVASAFEAIKCVANESDQIIVFGSFYTVGAFLTDFEQVVCV